MRKTFPLDDVIMKKTFFVYENQYENLVGEVAAILLLPQYVKRTANNAEDHIGEQHCRVTNQLLLESDIYWNR